MRILRIAQHLYPDTLGGAQYHIHAMSRDQTEMGHDVTVLTTRVSENHPKIEKTHGYTVIRFPPGPNIAGNDISPQMARYLWNLDKDKFDLIHAHSHLYFSSNLAALKSKMVDLPLVITNHGLFSQTAPRWAQKIYLKTLGGWTFNQAQTVFCYTQGEADRLRSHGVRSDISIISNGIDATQFTPNGEQSDLINSDKPSILCVSRLVDGKRPKDAIKAVEELRDKHPNIQLYLCGDGYLREELERYISENNLDQNVTLLGDVAYDKMPSLYRSCDVIILPSEEEAGSPRVILEAMATEKPFVMSDLQQTTDVLNEIGITYPVSDHQKLAQGIEKLQSDTELANKIGRKGRELVKQEFNWEKTVEETTDTLRTIAEK